MTLKVTKQYGRGAETFCENFTDLKAAKIYIAEKLGEDLQMNIKNTVYKISEFGEVMNEYSEKNHSEIAPLIPSQTTPEESGNQGKGSGATFRPTPFNTAAKPKGAQQNWMKDEEEDKDQ